MRWIPALLLLGCTGDDEDPTNETGTDTGTPVDETSGPTGDTGTPEADPLFGSFTSLACETRPDGFGGTSYLRRDLTIGDPDRFDASFHYYGDRNCSEPTVTFGFGGTFVLEGPSPVIDGARHAVLTIPEVSVTPESAEQAAALNAAGDCGTATWEVGVAQDVTPTGCSLFGLPPNPVTVEYEVLYATPEQLFFAARPIDGSLMSTPELRTAALLPPARRTTVPQETGSADNLDGTWASLSCEIRPDGYGGTTALTRDIRIDGNEVFLDFHYAADTACAVPNVSFSFDGSLDVTGPSDVAPGAVEATITITEVGLTPDSADAVALLGSAPDCGTAAWELGVEQDVSATGCSVLGLPPNSVTIEYEVLYATSDQLSFAARPVDGSLWLDPANRATSLLVPVQRVP